MIASHVPLKGDQLLLVILQMADQKVDFSMSPYMLLSLLFGAAVALFFIYYSLSIPEKKPIPQEEEPKEKKKKEQKPKKEKKEKEAESKPKEEVVHPLLINILKGHTNDILLYVFLKILFIWYLMKIKCNELIFLCLTQ